MNPGIELKVMWFDDGIIELLVRGLNANFSGEAECYINDLAKIADAFRGFPISANDYRELVIGTFDPVCAGGGARFRLRCTDRSAHAEVECRIRSDPKYTAGKSEMAEFSIPVEPAAIDDFVVALSRMSLAVGSAASLRQAI